MRLSRPLIATLRHPVRAGSIFFFALNRLRGSRDQFSPVMVMVIVAA
jgi:hypothetical protein